MAYLTFLVTIELLKKQQFWLDFGLNVVFFAFFLGSYLRAALIIVFTVRSKVSRVPNLRQF